MRPAYWELSRPGKLRSPVVCGRKHCSRCGRWRHACDFDPRTRSGGAPCAFCTTCRRRSQREAYARLTAEQRERKREYLAIYSEAKRREAGVPPRRWRSRPTVVDEIEYIGLPVGPLLAELKRTDADLEALARRAGIADRTLHRYRSGESRHVRIDIADRLAFALGTSLWDLWRDTPAVSFHQRPRAAA